MALRLYDTIEPPENNDFAIINAKHVAYKGGKLTDYLPVCLTQDEYNTLVAEGKVNSNTPYLIREDVM